MQPKVVKRKDQLRPIGGNIKFDVSNVLFEYNYEEL